MFKKRGTLDFGHNFCKYRPIFKIPLLGSNGIRWTVCKSFAPHSRQITTPAPHHSVVYRPDALPAA